MEVLQPARGEQNETPDWRAPAQKRWRRDRTHYECADGAPVDVRRTPCGPACETPGPPSPLAPWDAPEDTDETAKFPRNCVLYARSGEFSPDTLVGGVRFDRPLARAVARVATCKTISFPGSVRTVLRGAFRETKTCLPFQEEDPESAQGSLESVVLPAGLREVEKRAFEGCGGLRRLDFGRPSLLEHLGEDCFRGARLTEVTLPAGVREVADGAFRDCARLRVLWTEGPLGRGLHRCVDAYVAILSVRAALAGVPLQSLRRLREVTFPEGVSEVRDRWFCGAGVERVVLPASVQRVGKWAFCGCRRLREIVLGPDSGLEQICYRAFAETALEAFRCPACLKYVGELAFYGCAALAKVEFAHVLTLGKMCLLGTAVRSAELPPVVAAQVEDLGLGLGPGDYYLVPEGTKEVALDQIDGEPELVVIPKSVRTLPDDLFCGRERLQRVIGLEGARFSWVGRKCFAESGLRRVFLPSALRQVGRDALADCAELREIETDEGIRIELEHAKTGLTAVIRNRWPRLGNKLLWKFGVLQDVQLAHGITRIGDEWFRGTRLRDVQIPATVREIGQGAFRGCPRLRQVVLQPGSRLRRVGACCFAGSELKLIQFPSDIREIGTDAFADCGHLELVCMHDGRAGRAAAPGVLRMMGLEPPRGGVVASVVGSLCSIDVRSLVGWPGAAPNEDVRIGWRFLRDLRRLRDVVFPRGLERVGAGWFARADVRTVSFSASIVELGACAFFECRGLRRVSFAEGSRLALIRERCFQGTGLVRVTFPASLEHLDAYAFCSCEDLKVVEFPEGSRLACVGLRCFTGVI